jgi:hypothetical protein
LFAGTLANKYLHDLYISISSISLRERVLQ